MQIYYLLLFSDWFSGDEKIPQSLYGLRKLGISCMGYGKPWKMTKKDQFENKKAINTLVIV